MRLIEVSDVALFGNVHITTPALVALLEREIPVLFHSHGGWFRGVAQGIGHRNVEARTAQYRASFDDAFCLRFARELVAAMAVAFGAARSERARSAARRGRDSGPAARVRPPRR